MNISNGTLTNKRNFIEKYRRLMKNLYCSWKNEGNIYRVSEISKNVVYTASSYCNQLWIFYLSNRIFRKHLKVNIIQLTSVTFASIQFEKLHHKGIRLNNVCIQWVFTIINFSQNSAKYYSLCQLQKNNAKILKYFESDKILKSYLFNKKNSCAARGFKIIYLPLISKESRGAIRTIAFRTMSSI